MQHTVCGVCRPKTLAFTLTHINRHKHTSNFISFTFRQFAGLLCYLGCIVDFIKNLCDNDGAWWFYFYAILRNNIQPWTKNVQVDFFYFFLSPFIKMKERKIGKKIEWINSKHALISSILAKPCKCVWVSVYIIKHAALNIGRIVV